MRYLILSDLHSNIEAVSVVLDDARAQGYDRAVLLGDLVGYGGSPNEVIELLRGLDSPIGVRGNHDKVVTGVTEGGSFHEVARSAALWTREVLTRGNMAFLEALPRGPVDAGDFTISHGSPIDEETYILMPEDAFEAFEGAAFGVAFFGHTHFTCAFSRAGKRLGAALLSGDHQIVNMDRSARYLFNPGSIGQPRDCNPKASYGILDTDRNTFETRRVAYDVASAQARILSAGLPEVLAQRLGQGV